MNHRKFRIAFACLICVMSTATPGNVIANSLPLASVGGEIGKGIAKFFGKQSTEAVTEYFAKQGSKELVERIATTAAREGGEEAIERVARLAGAHGPEALAALDNVPSLIPVLNALDELPAEDVRRALSRLAAGPAGRELAESVSQFGVNAIQSELHHPGVGLVLIRSLGDDGARLAANLTEDQAIAVARHADELAKLPSAQRVGIVSLLHNDARAVVGFMGRFVEANPGKSLFTVATAGVILAEPERILGGDEIVFDADGNPVLVSKPGIIGRSIDAGSGVAEHVSDRYFRPLFLSVLVFGGVFVGLVGLIKLWHLHRREQAKTASVINATRSPIDARTNLPK